MGSALCRHLLASAHEVVALGRREHSGLPPVDELTYVRGNPMLPGDWQSHIAGADVIINLTGESVMQRWTAFKRSRMWKSRVYTTRNVVTHIQPGQTLINISATGYYGDCGATPLNEESPHGNGFLAEVCKAWEQAASEARFKGARVIIPRLGVVLGNGGALEKMLPLFRLGMGGRLGSGHQWMPWIHIEDVVRALLEMAENQETSGVYNLVAPNPVTNRKFTEVLGNVLSVRTPAPVPKMVLGIIFGEASRVLLDSQRAQPEALLEKGFLFQYGDLEAALAALV
ncbi:MAG: TIGR01777 family oxidoreductase [Deltaproteobacteria bacterium]|nr:TIGR01777 family oxidoreductase [Deltaproteobacteria bacterium]